MAKKIEMVFRREEACDFLKKLAEAIEQGKSILPEYDLNLAGLKKVKFAIEEEQVDVTLKLDPAKLEEKRQYQKIKNRMHVYFEEIQEALSKDILPSRELVTVFIEDSKQMLKFNQLGTEFRKEYEQLLQDLARANKAEDLQLIKATVKLINDCKQRCHELYRKNK